MRIWYLKNRFLALKRGLLLHHENDISYMCLSCLIVHKLCISVRDTGNDYLNPDEEVDEHEPITAESSAGKKMRDALFYYSVNKLG